jgi:formylglycine-generating enzyme required for sulfatase activity
MSNTLFMFVALVTHPAHASVNTPGEATAAEVAAFDAAEARARTRRNILGGVAGTRLDGDYPMRLVPAGTHTVGCTPGQRSSCRSDEEPARSVQLTRGVLIGELEVTQGLYAKHVGANPSSFAGCGEDCPVESVTWHDAVAFANAMSAAEGLEPCYTILGQDVTWPAGLDCEGYRLPTAAEWEVAARGGEDFKFAGSDDLYELDAQLITHEVDMVAVTLGPAGRMMANAYGLHGMSGGVQEWAWDWHRASHDQGSPSIDPMGPETGTHRVSHGGSWSGYPLDGRVSFRGRTDPDYRGIVLGFRLARTVR